LDIFLKRQEADNVMHAVDKASVTPKLHGNMQKRYDSLLRVACHQVNPQTFFRVEPPFWPSGSD
jgi:hypothetical protein